MVCVYMYVYMYVCFANVTGNKKFLAVFSRVIGLSERRGFRLDSLRTYYLLYKREREGIYRLIYRLGWRLLLGMRIALFITGGSFPPSLHRCKQPKPTLSSTQPPFLSLSLSFSRLSVYYSTATTGILASIRAMLSLFHSTNVSDPRHIFFSRKYIE